MTLLIAFLTLVLVVNCLVLGLLILIQLPKKEAGAGVAFGAGATDALFGAGSGNALTKMTKYAATLFIGLSILLSILGGHRAKESNRRLEQELEKRASAAAAQPAPAATAPSLAAPATNLTLSTTNVVLPAPAAPAPAK
jgi:protein translocase SecG subunit